MMVANVVPLRRMPANRSWLSYRQPEDAALRVGQLIDIPIRGKAVQGVVWSITDDQPPGLKLQTTGQPVVDQPLLTDWQQRVVECVADAGSASLADVLNITLPLLTRKTWHRIFSAVHRFNQTSAETQTVVGTMWYNNRDIGLDDIVRWVRENNKQSTLILSPTESDRHEIVAVLAERGQTSIIVDQHTSPTVRARAYSRVWSGERLIVVGDLSALLLPWSQFPQIYLDQEEHQGHKWAAQYPHFDLRVVLQQLAVPHRRSTVAPMMFAYDAYQAPTSPEPRQRQLLTLTGKNPGPCISDALLTVIDDAVGHHQSVVCIAPRTGYASATFCRACGTALACPNCQRRISLVRGVHAEARCTACKTIIPLKLSCPVCGSSSWRVQGLGVEFMAQTLGQLRPDVRISPSAESAIDADVLIDTYQAYEQLRQRSSLAAICILNGDSMLSAADFSVAERAWQYLSRLEASCSSTMIYVQTFEEASNFWQRWLHYDDAAFYADEIHQRRRLQVPPAIRQWIVAGKVSVAQEAEMIRRVQELTHGRCIVRHAASRFHTPSIQRYILSFTDPAAEEHIDWRHVFPLPWHIDRFPLSWQD